MMSRRDAKPNAKAAIIDAAMSILKAEGLGALTWARIARKAGCAKGLINYHYPSRADLLAALAERVVQGVVQPRVSAMAGTGIEVVDETWAALLEQAKSGSQIASASLAALRREVRIDRAIKLTNRSTFHEWAGAVAAWMARSGFRGPEPADVAQAAWAVLEGFGTALLDAEPEALYPAYLTAWLGLIGALSEARA